MSLNIPDYASSFAKIKQLHLLPLGLSVLMGILLGLVGGGGSILTVPILVYVAGIEPVKATAYSLFVVGITSFAGSIDYYRRRLVELKTAIIFSLPSLVAVYLTRLLIIPAIPNVLFQAYDFPVTKGTLLLLLFALLMLGAAYSMITSKCDVEWENQTYSLYTVNFLLVAVEGAVVGLLTGLVGAGGGFLIIPALVILAKLPMKLAVGTSLVIIMLKSLVGFIGDIQTGMSIDWSFLLSFTGLSVAGIFIGSYFSRLIDACKLRRLFGWLVVVMATFMLIRELWH